MLTSTEDIFRELIVEDIFWSNTIQPTTPPEAFQVNNSFLLSVPQTPKIYHQHYKQQYLLSTKCYFTWIFLLILKYSVK